MDKLIHISDKAIASAIEEAYQESKIYVLCNYFPLEDSGIDGRQIIALLRDIPTGCDICGRDRTPEDLNPASSGEWICFECWDRLDL